MAVTLPNPFNEDEDSIRQRFYETLDALFPNPSTRPDLREASFLDSVLAPVVAELARFYDGLNYTLRKAFVQTADGLYLDNKGMEIGLERNQAVGSSGIVRFYGDAGTLVPVDTTLSTTTEDAEADTYTYKTTASGTIVATADPVSAPTLDVVPLNEIRTLAKTGTVSSGSYTMTYNGQTTASINYADPASTIQTRLEALSTIGTGNVAVSGGPLPGNPVTIEFKNALGRTNLTASTFTVASGSLVGGGSYGLTTTQTGAPGSGTNIVGDVRYKYTYVTKVGDSSEDAYDAGYGETAASPASVPKTLTDQSVTVTIPAVPVLTGLNEITRVNLYRSLDTGGGYSEYRLLPVTIVANTAGSMVVTDNLDRISFEAIEVILPDENTTGLVDLPAAATDAGIGTNAPPNTVTLMEDLVDGVTGLTNRSAFTGGADLEDDESYRKRLQDELTKSPGAGNLEDYRTWAREVDGIENVNVVGEWLSQYTSPSDGGPGSVRVIVSDTDNSAVTYAKLEEVRQHIAGDVAIQNPYDLGSDNIAGATTPTGTSGLTAGSVYGYVFTFMNVGGGETAHSAVNSSTGLVDTTKVTDVTIDTNGDEVDFSDVPLGPSGTGPSATIGRRIYRARKTAGTYGDFLYVGQILDNTDPTFTDNNLDGSGTSSTSKIAPTTNSTSKYNGKSPIGAHVTVDTISEVEVTVTATIIPETGYNLAGSGGNINLGSLIDTALEAVVRAVAAGETLYLSDIQNAIHDVPGVRDFRLVTLSHPTGTEDPALNNGNLIPITDNVKLVYGTGGTLTEGAI